MNRKSKRIIMAFVGIFVTGISVGFFRYANFGVDPYSVLLTGLAESFHTSFAATANVMCALLLIFAWKFKKSLVGLSTLLNLAIYGIVTDTTYGMLTTIGSTPSFAARIIFFIVALLLMVLSAAFYYTADLGVSTYDAIALILADRKVGKFKYCRIGADLFCIAAGFAAGGELGIGTVAIGLLTGPMIQYFRTTVAEPFLEGHSSFAKMSWMQR